MNDDVLAAAELARAAASARLVVALQQAETNVGASATIKFTA